MKLHMSLGVAFLLLQIVKATPTESLRQPRLVKIVRRASDPPTTHKAYRFVSSLKKRGEEELGE